MRRRFFQITSIVVFFAFLPFVFADVRIQPGYQSVEGELISPSAANDYFSSLKTSAIKESTVKASSTTGETFATEISELAKGLRHDPDLIYQFVKNNIEYTPIYGLNKSPLMTLMDREGNDFDQAYLMVALLRESGYEASFVYGTVRLWADDAENYFGIPQATGYVNVFLSLLPSAGIPSTVYAYSYDELQAVDFSHVWVKVEIDGQEYAFDPSIKKYTYHDGIDIESAMQYNQTTFLSQVSSGATITSDYVQNLNGDNLSGELTSYCNNLVDYIKTNNPTASLKEIIGGREILPTTESLRQTTLSYQQSIDYEWTDIPDSYKTSLRIQHLGIDQTYCACEIYGKRLTIFYNTSNQPVLYFDGEVVQTGTAATVGSYYDITLTVDHPYASNSGTYCDDSQTFSIKAGGSYVIVNGWAGTGSKILDKHKKILKQNKYSESDETSESVLGESLMQIALLWLGECSRTDKIFDHIASTVTIEHHTLGVCGQNESPYIDMPMCLVSNVSLENDDNAKLSAFFNGSGHSSAYEWGVIEQLQSPKSAVCTVKLIGISNDNSNKIFQANSSNYASTVKPQLTNYSTWEYSQVEAYINAGYRVILPQDGNLSEGSWEGIGFLCISSSENNIGHIISGGLHGGFGTEDFDFDLIDSYAAEFAKSMEHAQSAEPIDLVTGDYLYGQQDLAIGSSSFPIGLSFSRSYNSSTNLEDYGLGLGWKHNVQITVQKTSDGFRGLSDYSPVDAVASIVECTVSMDLLKTNKSLLNTTTATLTHRWLMNQLINNVVSVNTPDSTVQFLKVPNGGYIPQSNKASTLIELEDGYKFQRKHGESIIFNSDGFITEWNDTTNKVFFTYNANKQLSNVANEYGRTLTFTYDGQHIDYITDSAGRVVDYSYDSDGQLISVKDPNGFTTTYAYESGSNQVGLLKSIYYPANPSNPYMVNAYNDLGQVETQADSNGNVWNYYYAYYRTEEVDPNSFSNTYTFNDHGNETSHTDQNGDTVYYEYDGLLRKTKNTSPSGVSKELQYDSKHNITQITTKPISGSSEPDIIESFTYESVYNRVQTQTDAKGNTTTYDYYSNGKVKQINMPEVDGQVSHIYFTYNGSGLLETMTNSKGVITKYDYDSSTGDLIQTIVDYGTSPDNLNITTAMTYDAVGNLLTSIDPKGNTTAYEYNPNRQLLRTISPSPFNYKTEYKYDPDGNLLRIRKQTGDISDPWQSTLYTYTKSGKTETITDSIGRTTTYVYDVLDRLVKTTDDESNTTQRIYDATGNIYKIINAEGHKEATYTYDQNGNLETITDANGNTTEYEYDDYGRLKKTIYPDTTFEEQSYDQNGNVISLSTRTGQVISYEYDSLNRPKKKILPGLAITNYDYDLVGKLVSTSNPNGLLSNKYDSLGRLSQVVYSGGKTISYEYDKNSNRTALMYPDSSSVNYEYDSLNRLADIKDSNGQSIVHYEYDALSRRQAISYENGTSANYEFDNANQLSNITNNVNGASLPYAYTYDNTGNRLSMTTMDGIHQYGYDKAYQLIQVDYPAGFFKTDTAFNYDPTGNRDSVVNASTQNYTVNNLNQYTSVDSVSYSYDNNGNLTNDGINVYAYDAENRLISATTPSHTASYEYDPMGRRFSKTVDGTSTKYLYDGDQVICEYDDSDKLTRKFVYGVGIDEVIRMTSVEPSADIVENGKVDLQDFALIAQLWMLNNTSSEYNINADITGNGFVNLQDFISLAKSWELYSYDAGFIESADINGSGNIDLQDIALMTQSWMSNNTNSGTIANADLSENGSVEIHDIVILAEHWLTDGNRTEDYYYHYDGLGSVIALSDSTGNVVETYNYDVYGQSDNTSSVGNTYLFTGRRYDPETGLYYYRARMYSAIIGRFLQTDPIGYSDGLNLYASCSNNPIYLVDPFGLCGRSWLDQIWRSAIMGDFDEGNGWAGVGTQVGVGLIPVVGQFADARDTVSAIKNFWQNPSWESAGGVAMAGVAWIPLLGDYAKGTTKAGREFVSEGAQAAAKKVDNVGSYSIEFISGKRYHGKGPISRAKQSGERIASEYGDEVSRIDWTPAANNRGAFKAEDIRIQTDGGIRNPNNYNKINSPGRKYNLQDGGY